MDQTTPTEPVNDRTKPAYLPPALPVDQPRPLVAAGTPSRHPAMTATPDAATLLKALSRRWVLALVLGLVAAGTVGPLAWFLVPPSKYTARASLHVAAAPRRIMFEPRDNSADPSTYQRTVVAFLKDQFIISHALSSPEVAGLDTFKKLVKQDADIEEWVNKNIGVSFRDGSEVLEVSLSGDNPKDVAAVVNAIVDSYMTLIVEEEGKARLIRLEKLKELWGRYQRELKLKRKSLEEVAASVGSHDELTFALAQQFKTAQLNLAQGEHMRAQSEVMKARAELEALEKAAEPDNVLAAAPEKHAPEVRVTEEVERHPDVAGLKQQLDRLDRKYREADRLARDKGDQALVRLRREKQVVQKNLEVVRSQMRSMIAARTPPPEVGTSATPSDHARDKARLRVQIEVVEGYQKALKKDVERLQAELKDFSKNGLDLESERQEISIATEFAQKVGAEVEAVQVELNAPDRVRVLARAKPPRLKDESRQLKAGGAAALASFALSLLGIAFWEFRARRIDSHDEVVNILGMKLVGTLPDLSRRPRKLPAPADDASGPPQQHWQSPLVESINAARTMLLHASYVESVRVVMITSAVKGEGKTSLSCHLATSLARAGRRVLLIDADLRRPAIHHLFNRPLVDGLCELLRGQVGIEGALQQSAVANLDVITAGRCDATAVQALARDGLGAFFERMKLEYDFVIVDSAPILPVADSLLVAQSVDGVIFSILRNHSRLPEVHSARERLGVLGVKVLGAVINGVRAEGYHEYYVDGQAKV